MTFDIKMIKKVNENKANRVNKAHDLVRRSLALIEKILYNHLWHKMPSQILNRGVNYVEFAPDRVAFQIVTA
jgi:aconitate hydratase